MKANKINQQCASIQKKLNAYDVYVVAISIHNNRATLNLGSAYLDFALLQKVSEALGTTDINVEGSVEHGYYDETNANLTLDIGLPT